MTKLEYSSCSGPSYTDLLPQASGEETGKWIEIQDHKGYQRVHTCAGKALWRMSDLASWSFWSCMCWRGNKSSRSLCLHLCPAECWPVDRWKQMWKNEREQAGGGGRAPTGAPTRCRACTPVPCPHTSCSRASGRWGRRRDGRCLIACGCTGWLWSGCRSSRGPPRSCWPGCRAPAPAGWPGTSGRGGQTGVREAVSVLPLNSNWRQTIRGCEHGDSHILHPEGLFLQPLNSQNVFDGNAAQSALSWRKK